MSTPREAAEGARERGIGGAEAEAFDLRLRLEESLARERTLVERALEAEEKLEEAERAELELREHIRALGAFHRAVERSAAWRFLQFLRGLIGRKW